MNQCEFKTRPYLPAQVIGDIQFQAQITQAHTCQMINLEEKDMQLRVKPADLNLVCKNESPQSITVLYFNTLFAQNFPPLPKSMSPNIKLSTLQTLDAYRKSN